jgi:hypothetical protein
MVFKYFQDVFDLKESTNDFIQFHQLSSHVTYGHIPQSIACIFGVIRLLTLAKPLSGIKSIVVGKAFYQLMGRAIYRFVTFFFSLAITLIQHGG